MVLLNASGAVSIPLWASIPFVVMLLTIALGPLFFSHWWDK
ncbi:MAG: sodium:proton antiporter, partial [bacterium]|nr:sodium:proton antiporter [Candidatus Aphodosoma intestinipullorum]